jgi:hypothetical protein
LDKPINLTGGKTDGYFVAIETNGRGGLHAHMLLWTQGKPKESDEVEYYESIITADIEENEDIFNHDRYTMPVSKEEFNIITRILGKKYCCHRPTHTATCFKKNPGFPKQVNETTFIRDGELFLKRNSPWAVENNRIITYFLTGNNNIMSLNSAKFGDKLIYCITYYTTKNAPSTYESNLFNSVASEAERSRRFNDIAGADFKDQGRRKLIMASNLIGSGLQEYSAPQVAFYTLYEQDHFQSHKPINLTWTSMIGGLGNCNLNLDENGNIGLSNLTYV